jgi:hypothetical protein
MAQNLSAMLLRKNLALIPHRLVVLASVCAQSGDSSREQRLAGADGSTIPSPIRVR